MNYENNSIQKTKKSQNILLNVSSILVAKFIMTSKLNILSRRKLTLAH